MKAPSSTPAPIGYCPRCGYDQRGLAQDAACPECGEQFHTGVVKSEINRWADDLRLHLWCVGIVQLVGWLSLLVGKYAGPRNVPGSVMLIMTGTVYLLAAWCWYVGLIWSFIRRRRRAALKNVTEGRTRVLYKWFVWNALAATIIVATAVSIVF